MKAIIGWLIKKIGVAAVLAIINGLYIAFLASWFIFIINALHTITSNFQTLFNLVSSGGSVSGTAFFNHFLGYLDAVGFLDALRTSYPLIISSIVFLLTSILYKKTKTAYKEFVDLANSYSMI